MTINERFALIIKELYNGNKRAFAKAAGLSATVVENVVGSRRGKPSYDVLERLCANANISPDWLITGHGEMLRQGDTQLSKVEINKSFPLRTDKAVDIQSIPLYDINAAAGLTALFNDSASMTPLGYLQIPNLSHCDGAISVLGDSMYPLLKSGDVILYREVKDMQNSILWGEMYLLSFCIDNDDYICIKYIQKGDDSEHIRLVSHNPYHSPKDIPVSSLRALALIKASVRYNTMG